MDKQQIRKTFNWEDENSYKWVIKAPGNVGLTVFFTLLYLIFIPTIIYSLLYLIGLLSEKVSFYIAFVLFILWLGYIVLSLLSVFTGNETDKNKGKAYLRSQSFVFIALVAYVISSPVSFWSLSFITVPGVEQIGVIEWIRYFLDNIFSVVFIGIFDIFNINLSDITPITWGAKAMIFLFNLVLAIGIIDAIIEAYSNRKEEVFFGTLQEFYFRCDNLPVKFRFDICLEGIFSKIEDTISFDARNFVDAFVEEAKLVSSSDKVDEKSGTQGPS